ncbi:hypothetical protein F2P81_018363 [Scophthalmus maximus]|uniref:Uncharacterized protein n=1 Tax=Scophthalmus maximus TaxID=52904 RepID=A0A6A4SAG9_SCOMX|nr:hypothetical protein F2P81_018363 [Scophthalmus maximus]
MTLCWQVQSFSCRGESEPAAETSVEEAVRKNAATLQEFRIPAPVLCKIADVFKVARDRPTCESALVLKVAATVLKVAAVLEELDGRAPLLSTILNVCNAARGTRDSAAVLKAAAAVFKSAATLEQLGVREPVLSTVAAVFRAAAQEEISATCDTNGADLSSNSSQSDNASTVPTEPILH